MHSGKSPRLGFGHTHQADEICVRFHKHTHTWRCTVGWNQTAFASFPALRCTVEPDYTAQRSSNTPLIMCTHWLRLPQHQQGMNTRARTHTHTHKLPHMIISSSQQTHTRVNIDTHTHTHTQNFTDCEKGMRSHCTKPLLTPTLDELQSWWLFNLKWYECSEALCVHMQRYLWFVCVCVGACQCICCESVQSSIFWQQ